MEALLSTGPSRQFSQVFGLENLNFCSSVHKPSEKTVEIVVFPLQVWWLFKSDTKWIFLPVRPATSSPAFCAPLNFSGHQSLFWAAIFLVRNRLVLWRKQICAIVIWINSFAGEQKIYWDICREEGGREADPRSGWNSWVREGGRREPGENGQSPSHLNISRKVPFCKVNLINTCVRIVNPVVWTEILMITLKMASVQNDPFGCHQFCKKIYSGYNNLKVQLATLARSILRRASAFSQGFLGPWAKKCFSCCLRLF